jgi:D-lactate dehydrogenase
VAEAVLETVPHGHHTTTGLIFFDSIDAASAPVPDLVAAGASAVELMVNASLIAATYALPGMPEAWGELPPEGANLLVELRTEDPERLDELERGALAALEGHELSEPAAFTRDVKETEVFWHVREGMQGIVGAVRPPESTFIIEDVCVPPDRIAESARDIQALLGEHEFLTGVAGHASAGNLHFLLTPNFSEPAGRERYDDFMTGLVDLVVERYDGSLKAEHGTGRSMAPYVEREWGEKATELMWRVKALADPSGALNPEVVLSRDPELHMRNLKSFPAIEEAGKANTCIECGFCEPVCPSRDLTTTPRQRIVLRREMARQPEGSAVRRALVEQYAYDALDTCAADGSCKLVCPLGIDTGELVKDLRADAHSPRAERVALRAARRYATAERAARAGLRAGGLAARVLGDRVVAAMTEGLRFAGSEELIPRWSSAVPRPAAAQPPRTEREGAAAVYMPACVNRIFGVSRRAADELLPVPAALVEVSARAGQPLWIPPDVAGHCCAVPWSSKGYREGHAEMAARTAAALRRWTDDGKLPVVIDASSCAHGLAEDGPEGIEVLDSVVWAHDRLLPHLEVRRPAGRVTVHPSCSTRHLGQAATLESLARALAAEVVVPLTSTCCGFAGDRGLLHPELTAAATRDEAAEVAAAPFDAYLSANRTCEIGLEQATGQPYESAIQLLERATRP